MVSRVCPLPIEIYQESAIIIRPLCGSITFEFNNLTCRKTHVSQRFQTRNNSQL